MFKNFSNLSVPKSGFLWWVWRWECGFIDHAVLIQARILPQIMWDSLGANISTHSTTRRAFQSEYVYL